MSTPTPLHTHPPPHRVKQIHPSHPVHCPQRLQHVQPSVQLRRTKVVVVATIWDMNRVERRARVHHNLTLRASPSKGTVCVLLYTPEGMCTFIAFTCVMDERIPSKGSQRKTEKASERRLSPTLAMSRQHHEQGQRVVGVAAIHGLSPARPVLPVGRFGPARYPRRVPCVVRD